MLRMPAPTSLNAFTPSTPWAVTTPRYSATGWPSIPGGGGDEHFPFLPAFARAPTGFPNQAPLSADRRQLTTDPWLERPRLTGTAVPALVFAIFSLPQPKTVPAGLKVPTLAVRRGRRQAPSSG